MLIRVLIVTVILPVKSTHFRNGTFFSVPSSSIGAFLSVGSGGRTYPVRRLRVVAHHTRCGAIKDPPPLKAIGRIHPASMIAPVSNCGVLACERSSIVQARMDGMDGLRPTSGHATLNALVVWGRSRLL